MPKRRRLDNNNMQTGRTEKLPVKDKVKEMKDLLRSSATQQEPSDQLILWNIDRLVKVAKKYDHEDADIYEELARQANRYQGRVDMASLCLTVLGGNSSDIITKALSKCLRGNKNESTDVQSGKGECSGTKSSEICKSVAESPLNNLYGSHLLPFGGLGYSPFQGQFVPHLAGPYQNMMQSPMGQFSFRPRGYRSFGRGYQRRQRGSCWFCDSVDHLVKDCPRMKAAKGK